MPKQNRVTPFGDLVASTGRGTFMGNRGVLHDADGRIERAWRSRRWLVCVLEFRGRRRPIRTPGRYTELFFLDEATALAAGHRPCAECRRARFRAFAAAWASAQGQESKPTAADIDDRLHAERIAAHGSRPTILADLDTLPDGVFVTRTTGQEQAYLVWGRDLLAWSPSGYAQRQPRQEGEKVQVLTPPSTVGTIRAGYLPTLHPSALASA